VDICYSLVFSIIHC